MIEMCSILKYFSVKLLKVKRMIALICDSLWSLCKWKTDQSWFQCYCVIQLLIESHCADLHSRSSSWTTELEWGIEQHVMLATRNKLQSRDFSELCKLMRDETLHTCSPWENFLDGSTPVLFCKPHDRPKPRLLINTKLGIVHRPPPPVRLSDNKNVEDFRGQR